MLHEVDTPSVTSEHHTSLHWPSINLVFWWIINITGMTMKFDYDVKELILFSHAVIQDRFGFSFFVYWHKNLCRVI